NRRPADCSIPSTKRTADHQESGTIGLTTYNVAPIEGGKACRDNGDSKQLAATRQIEKQTEQCGLVCPSGAERSFCRELSCSETEGVHTDRSPNVFVCAIQNTLGCLHVSSRRWSPCLLGADPLRLIVGYGFMQHGFAKLLRGGDNFAWQRA